MITGATKNKVDDIWQRMWEGGVTNPIEVIMQLTYLMFMKSLDDKELEAENMEMLGMTAKHVFPQTEEGQAIRWSRFKDLPAEQMFDVVSQKAFPFIKTMHSDNAFAESMEDAAFGFNKPKTLEKAVSGIDELLSNYVQDADDLGDLYEYMLSKLNTAGTNGQFRTPQHIRNMMVALAGPKPGQLICDPACGTAGFLISAAESIRKNHGQEMTEEQWKTFSGEQFTGFDTDQTMVRISAMNLLLHSIDHPDIRNQDSLSRLNAIRDKFDLILANPPFTGSVDVEDIDDSLKAVIYMPSGVFKPYSGVSTAILVFTKTDAGGTDKVWLYNMEGDGYTLDDKRDSDEKHNDIPDILERWGNLDTEEQRARTDKSFLVPKSEIVENDYDFSFNKYAETKYERIEYPPTEEILADLDDLNRQMTESLAELHKMLGGAQND